MVISPSAALLDFLRENGAHLHPGIIIAENESSGLHWRAKEDISIEPGSTIISVSHSIAFSYLNALVDEQWPVFKSHRHRFKPDFEVEAITFFYLMIQYTHRKMSFWKPYLDALPRPNQEHTQPLFYEDEKDIAWLKGTDVWHTNEKRTKRYREIYEDGKNVLENADQDVSWCTWDLFKWAAAIFTSRSFSSRAVRPPDSKYWAAYRHSKDGTSQTVLIDMSHASSSDFPVLFPGLDIGNHSNEAKIEYIFDPGRFNIKTNTATLAGEEVFNNYGPKSNDELLLGYGFCIPRNPYNTVSLMLKPPPMGLQEPLKAVHLGYFHSSKPDRRLEWNAEKATFELYRPATVATQDDIFQSLPEPLLELLTYVLHHERDYSFTLIEQPRQYLATSEGKRCLPHIANILIQSLFGNLSKLHSNGSALPSEPQNTRQRQAAIYRSDLRDLIISILTPLQTYLKSLVAMSPELILQAPSLVRLETFIQLCEERKMLPPAFLDGIEANANTRDLEQLRLAGWEQDIWILLLTALSMADAPSIVETAPPYVDMAVQHLDDRVAEIEQDPTHPSHDLLHLVRTAAESSAGIWRSPLWNGSRISEQAKRLQFDALTVMCPIDGDGGEEEARLCVYMHHDGIAARS